MSPLSAVLLLLVLCQAAWSAAEGKRVLVIPMPLTSHTNYHTNIARELVKLGHHVWLTMPHFLLAKGVLDTTNLSVVEYWPGDNVEEHTMYYLRDKSFNGEREDFKAMFQITEDFCDVFLKNKTLFQDIKKLDPEFIVIDNALLTGLSIIPYRLGIPFAFAGSAFDPITQRVPFSPAVTPMPLIPFSDHMELIERLQNTILILLSRITRYSTQTEKVSFYAPEMPYLPLDRLVARAELWLVEMDMLDYPRPSLPNIKLIGGTATGPAQPLPAKFQSFMDSATQGVVIVSFGSYVLHLPKDIGHRMLHMMLQLPLKFVFRSDLTSPDPEKILMAPWLPQNDLLGHPNTKVFFSHCGKNGQYKALYHAVPMVVAPLFVDQPYNAKRAQVKGFSETVDIRTMTAEELGKTVMKVATEKRYKQAISRASELFRIEFGVPVERAAFWLDHVMKYGGAHMRSAGHDIPYYQFLGLDILIILTTSVFVVALLFTLCCCLSLKWLCGLMQKPKQE